MADFSIGNIYAELSMDTSSLEASKRKAIKELGHLRDEGDKILKEAGGKMTEAMKIRLDEIEKNKSAVLKSIEDLNKQIREKLNPMKEVLGTQIESIFMQPLKSFASSSIDTFTQFQQSMQNTFSVMGASASDMKLLEDTAKKMGETTRFSASQASQALYSLGSAGQSATEAVNSLQGVLSLAGATGSDLAYTSETIASTLSQFNLEAGKASHIADVYAKAISKSQANMTKLSYSMKYVGPVASGLGISLETTTAALMKLYNTGYGGEQAGTYLKQAFQKLASGTNDLKTKLQELGISYEDVNPQTRNFADIINTLKEKNIGVTESIAIFGETAGGAMAKLIEEGGDAIATMEGLLKSSEGASSEMQEIQNASFANTKAELMSAMEAVQITTGSILEPALNMLAKGFTEVLKSVNGLPIGMQTFITSMLTASTAIVPFLTMPALITKIKKAMDFLNTSMLQNPIFIGGAVLATLASIAYSVYQQQKRNQELLIQDATRGIEDLKEMQKKAQDAGEKGRNIQGLLSQYETLKDKTNKTKEEQEAYNQTLKKLTELVPGVVTKIGETGEAYIENIDKIKLANEKYLQEEKLLNSQAKALAEQRYANALAVQGMYKTKEEQLKIDKANFAKKESTKKMKEMINEIANLAEGADIDTVLKKFYGEEEIHGYGNNQTSLSLNREQRIEKYQKEFNYYKKESEKLLEIEEDIFKTNLEVQKQFNALEEFKKKDNIIKKLEEPKKTEAPKQSKKEIINEMLGKDGTINKAIEQAKKEAKKYAKSLDEVDEEMKIIQQRLKEIYEIKAEDLIEGEAFNEKDAEPLLARYRKLEALKNAKNAPKAMPENKTKKEEVKEFKTFMDEVDEEYRKKKEEFDFTVAKIMALKTELAELKEKGEGSEQTLATIEFYQNTIEALQKNAKALSTELGTDFTLLNDIDSKIAELDSKDTNSFKAKFKAIREAKETTIKAITNAQSAGNIDEATAQAKIKKINDVALKSTITVGAELSKTILSVGNNVTDIILGAIEKGTLSLADGLNLVSQIGGQLADMIPDPMTKAVIGAVQMGIQLINKIFNYAENVRKENEKAYNKAMEEDDKKRQEKARMLAGDTASFYANQLAQAKKGANDFNTILSEMANKVNDNALSDAVKTLGEAKTSMLKDAQVDVKKTEWYQYQDKFGNWLWWHGEHWVKEWGKAQMSINELIVEWKKAIEKGDMQLANNLKKAIEKGTKEHFKKKGVDYESINNLKNYMQGIEEAFINAIKRKDFGALKDAMREKIRDAMLAKLQQSIIFSKLTPLLKKLEEAGETEKGKIINKINKEMENSYNNYEKHATKFLGNLGLVPSELEEHRKAWRGLKDSIKEALSSSLGDAAYNADWASFKKAFTSEMKKAIISSTVTTLGIKTKVDSIIEDIMKDGNITEEEINNSIEKLQGHFDELEGKLAPLAKITKALEGGVDVKSEHRGTIIQQLSGADRDYFAEEFRKNFASMKDSFKSAMIDLKEIHQAKITVENATLNVRDININAESALNLKELIAQMIEEARQAS
ncbi:MAG: phage tail tape measure protein [Treponema sp.]